MASSRVQSLPLSSLLSGRVRLDLPFLHRLTGAIEVRLKSLEGQSAELDTIIEQVRQVALLRINEVLTPAIQSIIKIQERGFLLARSVTPNTFGMGDILTWQIPDLDERALFTPSAYVAVTREDNPDDFAILRTVNFDRETGAFIGQVAAFEGDPGPHSDWVLSAVAGSTMAMVSLLEATTALHGAVSGLAGTVSTKKGQIDTIKADIDAKFPVILEAALDAAASAAAAATFNLSSFYSKAQTDLLIVDLATAIGARQQTSEKGQPNGYAGLDGGGKLPLSLLAGLPRVARTANTPLAATDAGKLIDITANAFTQTFVAAATLGSGWFCYLRNAGTGDITLDPNGAETIDGLASYIMYPGEMRLVLCDGAALRTVVISAFTKTFTTSGTFVRPPCYAGFGMVLVGGGGSGAIFAGGDFASGGGSSAVGHNFVPSTALPASSSVTVGAGALAVSGSGRIQGLAGGATIIASFLAGGGMAGAASPGTEPSSYYPALYAIDAYTYISGFGAGWRGTLFTSTAVGGPLGFNGGLTLGANGTNVGAGGAANNGGGGSVTSGAGFRGEARIWGVA